MCRTFETNESNMGLHNLFNFLTVVLTEFQISCKMSFLQLSGATTLGAANIQTLMNLAQISLISNMI